MLAFEPEGKTGNALTFLSTIKAGRSVCRTEITQGVSMRASKSTFCVDELQRADNKEASVMNADTDHMYSTVARINVQKGKKGLLFFHFLPCCSTRL